MNDSFNRSKPISSVEIETELIRITQQMEKATEDFEILVNEHAVKEAEY